LTVTASSSSPVDYPPGPTSKLPLGLFINFLRDPLSVLDNISQKYGDMSHFKFGKQNIYLINHPDYIKDVLVTYNGNFIKSRGLQLAKQVLGKGLLTSEGELHHKQRQLVQPLFQSDQITKYANIMTDYTLRMSNRWRESGVIDIHEEFMQLTLSIVSKAFFNVDIEEVETKEIGEYVTTLIEYFNRTRIPFAKAIEKLPLPSNIRFHHAKKQLDAIIYRIIDKHRTGMTTTNNNNTSDDYPNNDTGSNNLNEEKDQHKEGYNHKDLISLLLQGETDAFISPMNEKSKFRNNFNTFKQRLVRDNVATIFLAGHETVANALTWTFYLLSQNPKEEELLQQEIDSVLGDSSNEDSLPTIKDISKLEYTERVFAESMRIYPPAWAIGRQAINNCEIGNYTIPAGSSILMSQYLMHRNPHYFPQPERFDPERWTPQEKARRPRFSYFPFGGGPRSCIGESFAWMEGILLIATIVKRWNMRHEPGHSVVLQPLVTLRPKYGMLMKVIKRKKFE
jgi:cytochrome P450